MSCERKMTVNARKIVLGAAGGIERCRWSLHARETNCTRQFFCFFVFLSARDPNSLHNKVNCDAALLCSKKKAVETQ